MIIVHLQKARKVDYFAERRALSAALKIKSFQKKVWLLFSWGFQKKIYFHATNDCESGIIAKYFSQRPKGSKCNTQLLKMALSP